MSKINEHRNTPTPRLLVRQGGDIVCAAGNGGLTCDVGSSHPGAGVGPKGWAVRPLKRYASWVQNVVRQWITALSINLAICWKLRVSGATRRASGSEKASGADNQQGRPVSGQEPSETARQTRPRGPEDTVRTAWRHAESGRNDLALKHLNSRE